MMLLVALVAGVFATWYLALFGQEHHSKVALSVFQQVVQPLGAALLTGLFYWSQYLKPKAALSEIESASKSVARSEASVSATPQVNVLNIVQSPAPSPAVNIAELADAVIKNIAENRSITAATIFAENVVLVDRQKTRRAIFGLNGSGAAGMWACDADGRVRLWLGVGDKQDPTISFISQAGITRLGITDNETTTGLIIKGNDDKTLVSLMGHSENSIYQSAIALLNPHDKNLAAFCQSNAMPEGLIFSRAEDRRICWRYPLNFRTGEKDRTS